MTPLIILGRGTALRPNLDDFDIKQTGGAHRFQKTTCVVTEYSDLNLVNGIQFF